MSGSNKVVLIVGVLLLVVLACSLGFAEREQCGGRGCINQFPSPSVTR